jgi:hypothetical protein
MRHPGSFNPGSIANVQSEIQIVDTQKSIETRMSIGFPAFAPQFNRTLLTLSSKKLRLRPPHFTVSQGKRAGPLCLRISTDIQRL